MNEQQLNEAINKAREAGYEIGAEMEEWLRINLASINEKLQFFIKALAPAVRVVFDAIAAAIKALGRKPPKIMSRSRALELLNVCEQDAAGEQRPALAIQTDVIKALGRIKNIRYRREIARGVFNTGRRSE